MPFVAVPAGTLNHLARDLGLDTVDDAIAAVRAGTATRMDLGVAGDRCFVNTLTFGGYSQVVDTRERLEDRLGKWPALLVALVRELPRMEPLRVELDGQVRRVWLAWIGNCRYDPTGFGPSWREHLDDGLLDVRIVNGARRFSRTRFTDRRAGRPVAPVPRLRGAAGRVAVDPLARRSAAAGRRRRDLRRTRPSSRSPSAVRPCGWRCRPTRSAAAPARASPAARPAPPRRRAVIHGPASS